MIPPGSCRTYTDADWFRRLPENQRANENLFGNPQPATHRHCQKTKKTSAGHRIWTFPRKIPELGTSWHSLQCPFLMKLIFCAFLRLQMVMHIPKYFPTSLFGCLTLCIIFWDLPKPGKSVFHLTSAKVFFLTSPSQYFPLTLLVLWVNFAVWG